MIFFLKTLLTLYSKFLNMTAEKLLKIENNKKFRRYICSKNVWKSYAFIPPMLMLFGGLFGLLYLFNLDYLMRWYSIPFILIFIVGTIWFKSTRRFLMTKANNKIKSFKICTAIEVEDQKNANLFLFTSDNNRNNIKFLEKQRAHLISENNISNISLEVMKPMPITKNDFFIIKTKGKQRGKFFLLLINKEQIFILTKRELKKYAQ